VSERFEQFDQNLRLTTRQLADGQTKIAGVAGCLNSHYYGIVSYTANALYVGSWGKGTMSRPPRDVDVLFVLPPEEHERFERYQGNRQSALLQEVKGVLEYTYPNTDLRGDGQVVCVDFTTYNVEVIPAFRLTDGRFWICDTNEGGKYKVADPVGEAQGLESADAACNGNLRALVRMLKAWQAECNVPLDSFLLEAVAADFLAKSAWGRNPYFWYDWLSRDFFAFLLGKVDGFVFLPGTWQLRYLGNSWKSRAELALTRAIKACDFERENYVFLAGEEWQKIFGTQIPLNP